jgi:hypothetical protein
MRCSRAHGLTKQVGSLLFGRQPMIMLSESTVGVAHGLGLMVLIATLVIHIVITVLIRISYYHWLHPWVFPEYLLEFPSLWRDPIYWRPLLKGFGVLAARSVLPTLGAYLAFCRKDVLS